MIGSITNHPTFISILDSLLFSNPKDMEFITLAAITHLFQGIVIFLVINHFSQNCPLLAAILTFLLHTLYECKDYYLTYMVYGNDHQKMNRARKKISHWGMFKGYLPPNSYLNSIGDTIACLIGIIIGYYLRPVVKGKWITFMIIGLIIYYLFYLPVIYMLLHHKGLLDKEKVKKI